MMNKETNYRQPRCIRRMSPAQASSRTILKSTMALAPLCSMTTKWRRST